VTAVLAVPTRHGVVFAHDTLMVQEGGRRIAGGSKVFHNELLTIGFAGDPTALTLEYADLGNVSDVGKSMLIDFPWLVKQHIEETERQWGEFELLVAAGPRLFYYSNDWITEVFTPYAIGTGGDLALGAFLALSNLDDLDLRLRESVAVASGVDAFTNHDARIVRTRPVHD
jgi:ATP-dependent protease HslVU (ClpYQ) peptidase subunit